MNGPLGGVTRAPVRVALVTPRFPPEVGGLEGYVGRVAEWLQASDRFDVSVITSGRSARLSKESHRGIPVYRLGTWTTVSNTPVNPLWATQLPRLLRRLGVDVVNAHAPVPGLADLAAFSSPVPVVLTYHAGSLVKGDHAVDPMLRRYERHVLPQVFDRCQDLIAVSPVSLAYATGRAHLIPPGVDTDLFTPSATPASRAPTVLYVGRVERTSRWKGLQVLLAGLPRLRHLVPDVRLVVVGDGDDVPHLRAAAQRLGVAEAVEWRGAVPHADLPRHYREAGVTVLPSLTEAESFGMTLIEAMACGSPVVGSRVGGIPFVVRDGVDGLLVPPGDARSLADALARVLTDPAFAASLGFAGREVATKRWDWTHQRDTTLGVIAGAAGVAWASRERSHR